MSDRVRGFESRARFGMLGMRPVVTPAGRFRFRGQAARAGAIQRFGDP